MIRRRAGLVVSARLGLLAALASLPACGANLLVRRVEAPVRLPDGETRYVVLETRPQNGLLQPHYDAPVLTWVGESLVAIALEPVDLLLSTTTAITAMFDPDARVVGGPVGWLWAMTPCATLVPFPQIKVPFHVTDEQWADLTSDDRERRLLAADRIWLREKVLDVTAPTR